RAGQLRVENGRVLKVVDKGARVVLHAKKEGETRLIFPDKVVQIYISSPGQKRAWHSLKTLLPRMKGLILEDDERTVGGELWRLDAWVLIASIGLESESFRFQAQRSPDLRQKAPKHFDRLLRQGGLTPASLILEGT